MICIVEHVVKEKNGEKKYVLFAEVSRRLCPNGKGFLLIFISDKEEKEEPLEKTLKQTGICPIQSQRGGRNILPVGKSGEFALDFQDTKRKLKQNGGKQKKYPVYPE